MLSRHGRKALRHWAGTGEGRKRVLRAQLQTPRTASHPQELRERQGSDFPRSSRRTQPFQHPGPGFQSPNADRSFRLKAVCGT